MEKKIGEFKHTFILADKTFRKTKKYELTVHLYEKDDQIYFQLTMPKHIYLKVLGTQEKYLKSFVQKSGIASCLDRKVKFRQWLRNVNFHNLDLALTEINNEAMLLEQIEYAEKDKVIFVKFEHSENNQLDNWMHATMGLHIKSHFQFFVCYKRAIRDHFDNKVLKTRYESLEPEKRGNRWAFKYYWKDPVKEGFILIPYTEERERFLLDVQEGFIKLNKKLAEYLANLDANKLDSLITNKIKLLEGKHVEEE